MGIKNKELRGGGRLSFLVEKGILRLLKKYEKMKLGPQNKTLFLPRLGFWGLGVLVGGGFLFGEIWAADDPPAEPTAAENPAPEAASTTSGGGASAATPNCPVSCSISVDSVTADGAVFIVNGDKHSIDKGSSKEVNIDGHGKPDIEIKVSEVDEETKSVGYSVRHLFGGGPKKSRGRGRSGGGGAGMSEESSTGDMGGSGDGGTDGGMDSESTTPGGEEAAEEEPLPTGPYSLSDAMKKNAAKKPIYMPGRDKDDKKGEAGDVTIVIQKAIDIIVGITGVVAVFFVVFNGVNMATTAGDTERLTRAKNGMVYGVLGLALIVFSYILVKTIIWVTYLGEGV